VLILYAGRIISELSGATITESNIVGASFNLSLDTTVEAA
jgi:hypothetical protein